VACDGRRRRCGRALTLATAVGMGRRMVILGYVAAAGCASVWLDRLIFLPDTTIPHPPPRVEERWITTRDHVRIHAWYVPAREARATLVWSHGNAGNIAGPVDVALAPAARGVAALPYDYRRAGRSDGRPRA